VYGFYERVVLVLCLRISPRINVAITANRGVTVE
jgi:hypothetical protein